MLKVVTNNVIEKKSSRIYIIERNVKLFVRKRVKILPGLLEKRMKETNILKGLRDRQILPYEFIVMDELENEICFYTEYQEYKNLRDIIKEKKEKGEDFSEKVYMIAITILFIGNIQFYERFKEGSKLPSS